MRRSFPDIINTVPEWLWRTAYRSLWHWNRNEFSSCGFENTLAGGIAMKVTDRDTTSTRCRTVLLLVAFVWLGFSLSALADGPYEITWYTIDGGGGTSTGGLYTLTGTIGQPDVAWSIGGLYDLLGGFWPGAPLHEYTGLHYDQRRDVGVPDRWCANVDPRQCHGDADGKSQGKREYWVSTNDLDILIAAWNRTLAEILGEMLNGVALICADFDHLPQGLRAPPIVSLPHFAGCFLLGRAVTTP
jgi:hypothetical protein